MDNSENINRQLFLSQKGALYAGVFLVACFAVPVFCSPKETQLCVYAKINPNTASASELAQMPSIGPKRAQAIIDYRDEQASLGITKTFKTAEDLEKVKGIGKKTTENIKQFFEFEEK